VQRARGEEIFRKKYGQQAQVELEEDGGGSRVGKFLQRNGGSNRSGRNRFLPAETQPWMAARDSRMDK